MRTLEDAMKGADVFAGVSIANVLTREMVRSMADRPIILQWQTRTRKSR